MEKEKIGNNPNEIYKHLAKSEEDIKNGKVQKAEDAFEEWKQELSVYEQIKIGLQQAIEIEKTNKK